MNAQDQELRKLVMLSIIPLIEKLFVHQEQVIKLIQLDSASISTRESLMEKAEVLQHELQDLKTLFQVASDQASKILKS